MRPVRFSILIELGDVLASGLAQAFPFLAGPFVEGDGDLSAQVLGLCHVRSSFCLNAMQGYPKATKKAITNTIKESHTNEANATKAKKTPPCLPESVGASGQPI